MSDSHGDDSGEGVGFATARGRDWPSVRQFNVFLENRLGKLLDVVKRFETSDNHIVSLTVVDSADCAIIRIVLSDPERALEIFEQAKLPITESDLLVVNTSDIDFVNNNADLQMLLKRLSEPIKGTQYFLPLG